VIAALALQVADGRSPAALGAAPGPGPSPGPEIHYSPAENLELVDAKAIGSARLAIDMAAYVLSDNRVIEALTMAAERGVAVRIYFDSSQFAQHGLRYGAPIEALVAHPNVAAKVKGEGVLMHLKAYAVDGTLLRTGSGNFSYPGLTRQDNDLILTADAATVAAFERDFEKLWSRARNIDALRTPERSAGP
jgi:phosphatidylserine/phosphatidylglycerophosphate/cardiolipin synthase-like enzyme